MNGVELFIFTDSHAYYINSSHEQTVTKEPVVWVGSPERSDRLGILNEGNGTTYNTTIINGP